MPMVLQIPLMIAALQMVMHLAIWFSVADGVVSLWYWYETARWKEMGGTLDFPAIQPEPIADEVNAAVVYRRAFEIIGQKRTQLDEDDEVISSPHENLEHLDRLNETLSRYAEILRLLHHAAKRPDCDWGVDYSRGVNLSLPHLGFGRRAFRLLIAEAWCRADAGDIDGAMRSLMACRRLAESIRDGPALVCGMVYSGYFWNLAVTIEHMQRFYEIPPGRAEELLSGADVRTSQVRSLMNDVAMTIWTFQSHPDYAPKRNELYPSILRRANDALFLHDARRACAFLSTPFHLQNGTWENPDRFDFHGFQRVLVYDVKRINRDLVQIRTRVALGRASQKIHRFRARHGRFPTPEECEPPPDPYDGESLAYIRTDEGFQLRSRLINLLSEEERDWCDRTGNPWSRHLWIYAPEERQ